MIYWIIPLSAQETAVNNGNAYHNTLGDKCRVMRLLQTKVTRDDMIRRAGGECHYHLSPSPSLDFPLRPPYASPTSLLQSFNYTSASPSIVSDIYLTFEIYKEQM